MFVLRPRLIGLGLTALSAAVATVLLANGWLEEQRARFANNKSVKIEIHSEKVLVAKVDLRPGQFVGLDHVDWKPWPKESLSRNHFIGNADKKSEIVGAVVRQRIAAGQPLDRSLIVKPGDRGFMAAILRPGFRAVSEKTSESASISGFVQPGDQVDMLLTMTVDQPVESGGGKLKIKMRSSETVLRNVRVLAVNQKTLVEKGKTVIAKTVTVEVTPAQAERLAVADHMGNISLSLRSLASAQALLPSLRMYVAPKPGIRQANSGDHGADGGTDEGLHNFVPGQDLTTAYEPQTITLDRDVSLMFSQPRNKRPTIRVFRGSKSSGK